MPRHASIEALVSSFVRDLVAVVDQQASERARAHVLAALGGKNGAPARRGPGRPPGSKAKAAKAKPKRQFSAKQRRAAKLQGAYMGSMRTLPKSDQARVKAARLKDGVQAAIKLAKKLKHSGGGKSVAAAA